MNKKNSSFLSISIVLVFTFLLLNPLVYGNSIGFENNTSMENAEHLESYYNQIIIIDENNLANIKLDITIPPSEYLDLYKQMIGLSSSQTDNTFLMPTSKENLQKSLSMEQYYSLGIIPDFQTFEAENLENKNLEMTLKGSCSLNLQFKETDLYNYNFGSFLSENNDAENYILSIIAYTKKMLDSIEGEQIFRRVWTTTIVIPDSKTIENLDEINNKFWEIDFGDETYLKSEISIKDSNTLVISEEMIVSETEMTNSVDLNNYKSFSVTIFDPNNEIIKNNIIQTNFVSSWDEDFSFNKTISDEFGDESYTVGYVAEIDVNFSVHMDVDESWVESTFHVDITPYGIFNLRYNFDSGWYEIITPLKWTFTIPIGPVVVVLSVETCPEIRLEFESDAEISTSVHAWVDGYVKAGARYTKFEGFDNIWDYDFTYDYDQPEIDIQGTVRVKPAVSLPVTAKIYEGVIGITVRPTVYLYVALKYTEELYWYVKLGFNITIDVCIGIPGYYNKSWSWKIIDYPIAEWGNPIDNQAPVTTLLFTPAVENNNKIWSGRAIKYWFAVNDYGEIPSGIQKTFYRVDGGEWMEFNRYDLLSIYNMLAPSDYSKIELDFYSVDKFGNTEEIQHQTIYTDFVPPESSMQVDGQYKKTSENYLITPDTEIILDGYDEKWGHKIWYRINTDEQTGEWHTGLYNGAVILTDELPENGNFDIEWRAEDDLWNFELLHHEEFVINHKPEKPTEPEGIVEGKIDTTYTYTSTSSDTDGELLYYQWTWGDGNDPDDWIGGPYESGETVESSHSWSAQGGHYVMVRVKDENGFISPWSDPLTVSMPRNKVASQNIDINIILAKIDIFFRFMKESMIKFNFYNYLTTKN